MKVKAKTKRMLLDAKKRVADGGMLLRHEQAKLIDHCLRVCRTLDAIGLRTMALGLVDGRSRRSRELVEEIRAEYLRFSRAEYQTEGKPSDK